MLLALSAVLAAQPVRWGQASGSADTPELAGTTSWVQHADGPRDEPRRCAMMGALASLPLRGPPGSAYELQRPQLARPFLPPQTRVIQPVECCEHPGKWSRPVRRCFCFA